MSFLFKRDVDGLDGVTLVIPKKYEDSRGYFCELYKSTEFIVNGLSSFFYQDNMSYSRKNVIRGIHFQKHPKPQGKLVRCVKGSIWDVAVDLRSFSPTYLKWVGVELTEDNGNMLFIPEGYGHGFSVLSDDAIVQYKCTNEYSKQLDGGIRWNDPSIGVDWKVTDPVISEKDQQLPFSEELNVDMI